MTAHQKVIKDPDSRSKSHQAYQRKDTFKSLQQEINLLKQQNVTLNQQLLEERNSNTTYVII